MVHVMLVDDEYFILDGLKSFPWEKCGCEVIASAMTGQKALEQAEALKPELIFTDIKMPGMDGLEFASKVRENNKEVKIVFLTGYSNFEFAQKAVRIGAAEYLLKPVNPKQLGDIAQRLAAQIEEEKKNRKYYYALEKDYTKDLPLLKEKFINDLNRGRFYDIQDYLERADGLGIHIEKYVCCALTSEKEGERTSLAEAFGIRNICEEVASDYCSGILSEYDLPNQQCNLILCFQSNDNDRECIEKALLCCEKLNSVLSEVIHRNMDIGISTAGTDPIRLYEKFNEASKANSQSKYLGEHAIVKYDDFDSEPELFEYNIPEAKKLHLFRNIYSGDNGKVALEIHNIFDTEIPIENARFMALDLLINCMKYPSLCRINPGFRDRHYDYSFLQDGIRIVSNAESINEIENYLVKVLGLISKQANTSADDRYIATVNKVVSYMQDNYADDLSIDSVASHFYMSRTYLSRLIKKYTGHTFLTILVDIRMQEARKMILETEYKIKEIAEKVGYRDFSYFVQAFKKYYGVTPNEYRKTI